MQPQNAGEKQLDHDEIEDDDDEYTPNDTTAGGLELEGSAIASTTKPTAVRPAEDNKSPDNETSQPASATEPSDPAGDEEKRRRHEVYDPAYSAFREESKFGQEILSQSERAKRTWNKYREKANRRIAEIVKKKENLEEELTMGDNAQLAFDAEHEETLQQATADKRKEEAWRKFFELESDEVPT